MAHDADTIALYDEAATALFAARLAPLLRQGDVVALTGDLGAGKTSFARSLLRALGYRGEVPSPTFALVQIYETAVGGPDEGIEAGRPDRVQQQLQQPGLVGCGDGHARVVIAGQGTWQERARLFAADAR